MSDISLGVVTGVVPRDLQSSFERSNHQSHFADETSEVQITTDSTFAVKMAGPRGKRWDDIWCLT